MNVIKIKIDFEKGLCQKEGISVVTGDYNSTKIEFEFNESAADGRKIFELKNSDDELVYVDEIVDNEVILVGKREEEGEEELFSLFNKEGDYTFEVSLYGENSKLTSVYDYITARKEQVIVDDETVEQYMPLFDNLMQELSNKVAEADSKIDEIDQAIENVNQAVQDAEEAVESTNNLNIDVNKVDKTTQVDLTKKDGTTKTVYINDGTSLQFMWQGTSLGIKTDDMEQYVFVNLQGIQGQPGPQGEPFRIKKTYTSVAEMNADFDNMNVGDYVMIASTVEIEDNAKLYVKGDSQWIFITDFSGAQGIKGETGATPIIRIGTVTSGSTPSVTISGTAEEPVFNFVLQPGEQGRTGDTGLKGDTGNGIASIVKTASAGLIDTYTITFTDGTTTTFNVTNGQDGDVTQEYVDEENERLKSVFNVLPKVSDSGESVTLENTGDTMLYKMDLKGNMSQEVISGEVGTEIEDTSIYVDDVNEDKENYITLKGNTYQDSTSGYNNLATITNLNYIKTKNTSGNWNNNSYSINGITFTFNSNGTITINGTSTQNASLKLLGTYLPIDQEIINGNYIILGYTSSDIAMRVLNHGETYAYLGTNQSSTTPTQLDLSTFTTGYIEIVVSSGKTINNITIKPMLTDTSQTDFEPYTNGASPNPDYPQEIEVVTGLNEVKVEGKNLFDLDNIQVNNTDRVTYVIDNNNIVMTVVTGGTYRFISKTINNLTIGQQYTIKIGSYNDTSTNKIAQWGVTKSNGSYYDYVKILSDTQTLTFTPTEKSVSFRAGYLTNNCSTGDILTIGNIQLEVGSQATTYEPYKGQTYEVNLGSIELCKIGDYQDGIYKNNGNWYLHKEIHKIILDGSESGWNYDTQYKYFRNPSYNFGNNIPLEMNNANRNTYMQYMNLFKINKAWSGTNSFRDNVSVQGEFYLSQNAGYKVMFRNLNIDNVTDLQAWLSTHNVINYYPLATPTNTRITDTTLVNQLNALYNATIYSTTHINTETSNLLPYINLKYNVVTASPSPDRASEVEVVKGNNSIVIRDENNTKSQTYNITLGNLELCKIGNYQDYFYKDNGKWYIHKEIGKAVLNGSESNWSYPDTYQGIHQYQAYKANALYINDNVTRIVSNYFTGVNYNNSWTKDNTITIGESVIRIMTSQIATLADFKNWLSTHNTTCYYVLATPTTTQINDQLLVSQLDELQKAMSYYDKTIITQVNDSKPFILDVIGIRDLQDIFNLISGE